MTEATKANCQGPTTTGECPISHAGTQSPFNDGQQHAANASSFAISSHIIIRPAYRPVMMRTFIRMVLGHGVNFGGYFGGQNVQVSMPR